LKSEKGELKMSEVRIVRINVLTEHPEVTVLSIEHDGLATLTSWERGGHATFHFDTATGTLLSELKAAIAAHEAAAALAEDEAL
jgi:hypothetical protein